jgi:hypothetical protein
MAGEGCNLKWAQRKEGKYYYFLIATISHSHSHTTRKKKRKKRKTESRKHEDESVRVRACHVRASIIIYYIIGAWQRNYAGHKRKAPQTVSGPSYDPRAWQQPCMYPTWSEPRNGIPKKGKNGCFSSVVTEMMHAGLEWSLTRIPSRQRGSLRTGVSSFSPHFPPKAHPHLVISLRRLLHIHLHPPHPPPLPSLTPPASSLYGPKHTLSSAQLVHSQPGTLPQSDTLSMPGNV